MNDMPHEANESAPSSYEIKAAVDELGVAYETKLNHLNGEVERLEQRLDLMTRAAARPGLAGETVSAGVSEHKSAFLNGYIRKGAEMDVARLQSKSLNITANAEGGFAVPQEIDQSIERKLRDVSPIRAIASVVQVGTSNYKKLVSVSGAASGWVGEQDVRSETSAPQFAEVAPTIGEIYANPAATQSMLDDAFFDVEAWLSEELSIEFGAREGAAFVNGDGVNKPRGFLTYTTAAQDDASRAFGTLEHVPTGVAGDFPASNPSDILVDLVHALRPSYRQGAVFVMNTNTLARIRKFKDADGNYLWRPGLGEAAPATLLGYPVMEAEDMPDIGTDTSAIAFGNFTRGYLIADRMGTRILRDPYSNKPFVHFYATRRTGGAVVNSEAIKLLKFSLS